MNNKQKTYIIIINFGTPEHTAECLDSIRENNHQFFQAVVVDVLNINRSVEKLSKWNEEKKDDRFVLFEENENRGFAFANNIGIKYALRQDDCDFLWVLNNDTVIAKNSLEELLKHYEQNKNRGIFGFIGSRILDYENRRLIQNIGGRFNKWTGYSVLVGMGENDTGQFDDKEIKVDYVVGASMFCPSMLIQKIGLMSDDYFLYYEDIDWCITAQKAGFRNSTCTKSLVYHKQGISTGAKLLVNDNNLKNKKHLYLSYLKLYKRHYKLLLPVAYFILIKQIAGKIFHKNYREAILIFNVIFKKS
ncbi:MAG: glycosyltransferase family 2 protein [Bacteroidota bacterium]|nr:glycosyltransferase family 2 protein [Bacteroidota bacterium]